MAWKDEIDGFPPEDPSDMVKYVEYFLNHSEEVASALSIGNNDAEMVTLTLQFVIDALACGYDQALKMDFFSLFKNKNILSTIRTLIRDPSLTIRRSAVNVLGRIGNIDSIPLLQEVFHDSLFSDPLLTRALLGELLWLSRDRLLSPLATTLLSSRYSAHRWMLLDYLCSSAREIGTGIYRKRLNLLSRLSHDPRVYIRNQAMHERALLTRYRKRYRASLGSSKNRISEHEFEYRGHQFHVMAFHYQNCMTQYAFEDYGINSFEFFIHEETREAPLKQDSP